MRKRLLPFFAFLFLASYGFSQLPNKYYYYQGDTLNGFDVTACYKKALLYMVENHTMDEALPWYVRKEERAFVKAKYHLPDRVNQVIPPGPLAAACSNIDFEAGTFANWIGYTGYNKNSNAALAGQVLGINTLGPNSAETSCSYHTLVNSGNDPYGLFPMVDPGGGTWAARLGGENINTDDISVGCSGSGGNGSLGEILEQKFLVSKANALFTYSYAVILDAPISGHGNGQMPYFRTEVLNAAGDTVPCMQFYQQSATGAPPPGFVSSAKADHYGDPVLYTPWVSNSLNLTTLIGATITIRFTAAGCIFSSHFGYAYVDASCGPVQVIASTPEVCQGGTINLTAPPVIPGGTYNWSTKPTGTAGISGSTTGQTVTINANGTYEVLITQRPGCTYVIDTVIAFWPLPVPTVTTTQTSCAGNTGTATVANSTGTAPYTYSWNTTPAQTGATATGLAAGTYSVTVTTANGCTATASGVVTAPNAPTATLVNTPVSCFGGSDGTATVTAAAGTPAYTYSWTPAPASGTITTTAGLTIGTYTCTVTDSKGCVGSATTTITQPTAITATNTQVNELCFGASTGSATVTAAGGTPGYTYSWVPAPGTGQGTATAGSLPIGTYTCTVTDTKSCATTSVVTITQPTQITATTANTPAMCGASNGSASVTPTGGKGAYTYSWNSAPSQATATASGLPSGTYICTIKDANGCTITATVIVPNTGGPSVTTGAIVNVTCFGLCNGSITVNATGGVAPLTYSWTPAPGAGQGTTTASSLCAGTYTCAVTDAQGCTVSSTGTVTQPTALVASATGTNVSCFGKTDGTATGTASGGSPAYTYSWNPAPGGGQGTVNATGLAAGTYTFTLTDSHGCTTTATVTITQPPLLTVNAAGVNATCNGLCDGQLICIPSGGTNPYVYSWNPGSVCAAPSCPNICAGTYTSTVTDAHGCVATATAVVKEPTPLVLSIFPTAAHCSHSDGVDSVFASGGTPGYTYTWTPVVPPGSTTSAYHNIPPGNYTVVVHDANHCADSINNTVPNLPGVNITFVSSTNVSCAGGSDGSATVSGSAGFPPYTYSWTPSPVGGQGSVTATGLSAQTYTCVITDKVGCTNKITVPISQPPPLVVTPMAPVTICFGSCTPLTAAATGGTPAYTYSWTLNGTAVTPPVCPTATSTYTVICTDSHACPATGTVVITVNPPLEVVAANPPPICPGKSANLTATASGGNGGPYNYTWSPPTNLSNPNIQNPSANPTVTTSYTVIVSDNCGTPTDSAVVVVTVFPPPVVVFISTDTVACAPMCVNFTGNSTPACQTATWIFGDGSSGIGCNTVRHCYNVAGTYSVTYNVIDLNGCPGTYSQSNFIDAHPRPVAAFTLAPQPTTILSPEITFTDHSSSDVVSWNWNFGDFAGDTSILKNPKFIYPDTGCFTATLLVTNQYGCTDVVREPVCIGPEFTFYAPNTFTPNGDGKNDIWMPYGIGIDPKNYDLIMFDRWGNLMFETHVWGDGWDGRANSGADIAQIDTYVWKVNLKDVFGNKHTYIGHCNIVR
jgi:gliding motility-associated-like protein